MVERLLQSETSGAVKAAWLRDKGNVTATRQRTDYGTENERVAQGRCPTSMSKQYLGDGVYADVEGTMIKLTTENGIEATNTIYLEEEVWDALQNYVKWLQHQQDAAT